MIDRYSRPEMSRLWTEEAKFRSWAEVEKAHLRTLLAKQPENLARVLSRLETALTEKTAAHFQRRELETGHDVIAFLAEVADAMGEDGRLLHRGLTSSDILDTSLSLRLRQSIGLLLSSLAAVRAALAERAFEHAKTLCMGRTHGIHAEPLSFGQVLAGHFSEFQRAQEDLLRAYAAIGVGKLSGAVGQYSQLSPTFEAEALSHLDLVPEAVATQVLPRDRLLRVAQAVSAAGNAVERFATNVRHLARTELGEVLEPFSEKQKGSSAMPHKKNPVLAENLCGLARLVRTLADGLGQNGALWHERDISHSSVERVAIPDLFIATDFMLDRCAKLVRGMVVRPDVMRANLERTGGLWCSQSVLTELVERGINRTEAYERVQKIALPLAEKVPFGTLEASAFQKSLAADTVVSKVVGAEDLGSLFRPERFLAFASVSFERAFGMVPEEFHRLRAQSPQRPAADFVPALQRVVHVHVELLADVLDTETKAILADMRASNLPVSTLRQRKTFVLRLPGDAPLASPELKAYAFDVLRNPVMQGAALEVIQ